MEGMNIGFIGLGNMGAGMAANLLKAGHEVTAYNRSQDKVAALAEQGAKPAQVGRGGVRGRHRPHDAGERRRRRGASRSATTASSPRCGLTRTHVSSSTISVALSERLTAAHAEAGQQFVAAPVFGRPEAAAAAKLFVVAAG